MNEHTLPTLIELQQLAGRLGFSSLGVIPAAPANRVESYLRWIDNQFHGEMSYLARPDRVARRRDLEVVLPGVQSLVCVALDYDATGPGEALLSDPSRGRIAAYAWRADYHDVMLPKLEEFATSIRGHIHRAYVDTGAILERDHAESAQLGFTGKNTMLIAPRRGSWCLLGEILTTARLEPTTPVAHLPSCGSCSSCLAACPTDAFPAPYVLDSRRCISYLTIECKGTIPASLRPQLGNWVFGCDVCQTVCPFNRFATGSTDQTKLDQAAPELGLWLAITDAEFRDRYRGTPLLRTGRDRLVRNSCVAAGNSADSTLIPALCALLANDPSALIRAHAAWGIGRLGGERELIAMEKTESDTNVLGEIRHAIRAIHDRQG